MSSVDEKEKPSERQNLFECYICLDTPTEPVTTQCGHLFCWPCLERWLEGGKTRCPVCKAGVTRENVIPLYDRGKASEGSSQQSSSRPRGHRPEPRPEPRRQNVFGGNGISFSAGFGFGPFVQLNAGRGFGSHHHHHYHGHNHQPSRANTPQENLSFGFIVFAFVVLLFILYA